MLGITVHVVVWCNIVQTSNWQADLRVKQSVGIFPGCWFFVQSVIGASRYMEVDIRCCQGSTHHCNNTHPSDWGHLHLKQCKLDLKVKMYICIMCDHTFIIYNILMTKSFQHMVIMTCQHLKCMNRNDDTVMCLILLWDSPPTRGWSLWIIIIYMYSHQRFLFYSIFNLKIGYWILNIFCAHLYAVQYTYFLLFL